MADAKYVEAKSPTDCTPEQLDTFYNMVVKGGQVLIKEDVLRKNIANAKRLAFYWFNGNIVGIAALKVPQQSYKLKVFIKSGEPDFENGYDYELGYCYTNPQLTGLGICTDLVVALFNQAEPLAVFATTKTEAMKHILIKNGFTTLGKPYNTENSEQLQLYVYAR